MIGVMKRLHHQRGEEMIRQGVLPYKYEVEGGSELTALGGLPVYLDLMAMSGMWKSLQEHFGTREGEQGWTTAQAVMALILLNIAGGDCVRDVERLEADEGFCRLFRRLEWTEFSRQERRDMERRWQRERERTFPSQSAIFRRLEGFHDERQEELRRSPGAPKAFIPKPNDLLRGMAFVNRDMLRFAAAQDPQEQATLDMDATLIETMKRAALYCYKHVPAYQPLNVWWAETGLMLYTEFRDGNVPAGHQQLRVLKEALTHLPSEVKKVRMRSDTAGYQWDLLEYCARGEDPRFGRIEFACSCDVSQEFKKAVSEVPEEEWRPFRRVVDGIEFQTDMEWAEVCFVPNAIAHSKDGPDYRFVAMREPMPEQPSLPGIEAQQELPFPTVRMRGKRYKLFGLVTNLDWEGDRIIRWLHERCGKSEEAHAVLKHDLAGSHLPSKRFGVNAAWWWIAVLAHNLNAIMKRHVLGEAFMSKRLKAIRFLLIHLPAQVIEHARQCSLRLGRSYREVAEFLVEIRCRILEMVPVPSG